MESIFNSSSMSSDDGFQHNTLEYSYTATFKLEVVEFAVTNNCIAHRQVSKKLIICLVKEISVLE